jgi:hypothetical protein
VFNQHFDLAVCRSNGFIVITVAAFAQYSRILEILYHHCFKTITLLVLKTGMVICIYSAFKLTGIFVYIEGWIVSSVG